MTASRLLEETGLPEQELTAVLEQGTEWIRPMTTSPDTPPSLVSVRLPVISALEDDRWEWRTLPGVASDTGLPEAEVRKIIDESRDVVIRSEVSSVAGEPLFTTARHWDHKASVGQKLLGAFRNRRK
jgi:hypothetical protein